MLKKLTEEDFIVLREPFESGRQDPGSIAGALVLGLFLQPLLLFLTYDGFTDEIFFPKVDLMFTVHLWITGILMVLSLLYSVKSIYMRSQKLQYLISIVVSQNVFGVYFYVIALFFISELSGITERGLLIITFLTLFWGLIVFVMTSIRFYILLLDGQYREGTRKHEQRSNLGDKVKSYLSVVIGISTVLVLIFTFILKISSFRDIETIIVAIVCMLLYFTMIFVLPEQLVLLYCKFHFDSFNYNKKGKLNPVRPQKKRGKRK